MVYFHVRPSLVCSLLGGTCVRLKEQGIKRIHAVRGSSVVVGGLNHSWMTQEILYLTSPQLNVQPSDHILVIVA